MPKRKRKTGRRVALKPPSVKLRGKKRARQPASSRGRTWDPYVSHQVYLPPEPPEPPKPKEPEGPKTRFDRDPLV